MSGGLAEGRTDLRIPSHGRGRLVAPWSKGMAPNPTGRGGEYREVQRLAKEASPHAMRRLIGLLDSDDERIVAIATQAVLDRAHGKPRERPPEDDKPRTTIDISRLSDEDKALLRRLLASGAIRTEGEPAPTEMDGACHD